jgi:hypothetical protein
VSGGGEAGHESAAPSARGLSFARNGEMSRSIGARQGAERVPNHYYYHNDGGSRYWHYYGGPGGLHWYGFYFGANFWWFPFYSGYWWWYDPNYARYAYWYNGYWWWTGPGGAPYIYVNNNYIPYDQYQQQAQQAPQASADSADSSEAVPAPPTAPPSAPPSVAAAKAPAKEGNAEKSPDGRRMVQITGKEGGAFLFDESATPPVFMKHLGDNVEKVRFSGGAGGQPLRVLVDYKDGTFALFDENGNPEDKAPAAPATAAPAGK